MAEGLLLILIAGMLVVFWAMDKLLSSPFDKNGE